MKSIWQIIKELAPSHPERVIKSWAVSSEDFSAIIEKTEGLKAVVALDTVLNAGPSDMVWKATQQSINGEQYIIFKLRS